MSIIPNFYYNFYVCQYATVYDATTYLAEKVVQGSTEDRQKYLEYLKAGSSAYPLEVMAKAGGDMEYTDYLDAAFELVENRFSEVEN